MIYKLDYDEEWFMCFSLDQQVVAELLGEHFSTVATASVAFGQISTIGLFQVVLRDRAGPPSPFLNFQRWGFSISVKGDVIDISWMCSTSS
jgi:hypothetical protein